MKQISPWKRLGQTHVGTGLGNGRLTRDDAARVLDYQYQKSVDREWRRYRSSSEADDLGLGRGLSRKRERAPASSGERASDSVDTQKVGGLVQGHQATFHSPVAMDG